MVGEGEIYRTSCDRGDAARSKAQVRFPRASRGYAHSRSCVPLARRTATRVSHMGAKELRRRYAERFLRPIIRSTRASQRDIDAHDTRKSIRPLRNYFFNNLSTAFNVPPPTVPSTQYGARSLNYRLYIPPLCPHSDRPNNLYVVVGNSSSGSAVTIQEDAEQPRDVSSLHRLDPTQHLGGIDSLVDGVHIERRYRNDGAGARLVGHACGHCRTAMLSRGPLRAYWGYHQRRIGPA
ncbi:hypothetical protein C8Q73DRAFT_533670 [Cubamyces lactineus]|nr:hypothetical protein C8Q73DRAFT_533670 [Cubamyces lactineus]